MSNTLTVNIEQLIIGRVISFPINDDKGVLLLSAGSVITAEQMRRIKERGINHVVMDEADAVRTTLNVELAREASSAADADEKLSERLESMLGSGLFRVSNTGPAVRKSLVHHGRKKCDSQTRRELLEGQQQNSEAAKQIMEQAVRGEKVTGSQMADMAGGQIRNLMADFDSSLTMAFGENKDPSLAEHALRVSLLGMAIGIELGLDADNVRTIGIAGMVQDWGMARVPKEIRQANRPLTPIEFLEIQKHPMRTVQMLECTKSFPNIVRVIVYQTHERPDGSGYPQGREGKHIHLFARILHVADAYTAMTSVRPHRPPLMPYAALETLLRQARRNQVDPEMVRSLLHILSLFPIGSFVTLTDGSVAQVLRGNGEEYTRPIVLRIQDRQGKPIDSNDDSALIALSDSELSVVQALPTPGRQEIGLKPPGQIKPPGRLKPETAQRSA